MTNRDHLPAEGERSAPLQRLPFETGARTALTVEGPRQIVVVLGMHRSGTSLLSNILHVLGVDMADTTDHVSPKNPGGFWERPALVAIHDEILEAIGRPIALPSHVLPFPAAWWRSKPVQALKPKLIEYLRNELGKSSSPWGFKDPRTCRLLPLWWEIFRELNIEPIFVNAVRAPSEASVSMSQKSSARKMSVANGELMWLSYNYDVARYVTTKSRPIQVNYDEWFSDANMVAHRLCEELGIGHDLSESEIAECVASIVQPDYRHQIAETSSSGSVAAMFYKSLTASNPLTDDDLRSLRGQIRLVDMFFKSIAQIVHDLDAAAALQAEHDDLTAREAAAVQEVSDKAAELAALQAVITTLESRLEHTEAERDSLSTRAGELQEAQSATAQSLSTETSRRKQVESRLHRQRKRSRALLRKAKEWRASYAAEHGRTNERLEAKRRTAGLQRELAAAERRLSEFEAERARFIAELEIRDQALRQLRCESAVHDGRDVKGTVFTWPADGVPLEVSGSVDRVDSQGIAGHVDIGERNDVVPIVEVRFDGRFAAAQTCVALANATQSTSGRRWHFSFSWDRFALDDAGKEADVVVAGVEQHLGKAAIPADLRSYHLSPAVRVAAKLGGSIAEAAEYQRWLLERESTDDADMARAYRANMKTSWPLITILLFGEDATQLPLSLQSLQGQVYGEWQALCIDAPASVEDMDPRIKAIPRSKLKEVFDDLPENALFSFLEAGDLLGSTALLHLADAAQSTPHFALIYSDEDLIDAASGLRGLPYMKGAWSPDLALAQDYVSRLALVRRDKLGTKWPADVATTVYQTVLKAALSGSGPVVHIPFVLYHRSADNAERERPLAEAAQGVVKATPSLAGARVVKGADGQTRVEWPLPDPAPRVSLIVPTRDHADLLRICVSGFLQETRYPNLEILIADNDSAEEETKIYLAKISTHPRVRVISCPGPFNFSKINNIAAREASGDIIGLMNNDLKVFEPRWLQAMVRHAVRPDVGIVGAKLLYDDGTVQHAGVTLGIALASHLYKSADGDAEGRHRRLSLTQDVSAVTAACLLIRREVWDEVGGLDEDFPVAYNDVDLCLKVRAAGYRVLWTPDAVLYHLESKSRGKDVTPEKRERLNHDKGRLIERWGDLLSSDPFHSPNFSASHTDSRLSFPPRAAAPWQPAIAAQ